MPNIPYEYEPPWADAEPPRECRDCGEEFRPVDRWQNICDGCSEWHELQRGEAERLDE